MLVVCLPVGHLLGDDQSALHFVPWSYQWPGIAEITDITGIKRGYYAIRDVNPTGIVPLGPSDLHLTRPHDRGRLPAAA